MKTSLISSTSHFLGALLVSVLLITSGCKKEDQNMTNMVMFNNITLTGAQEAPNPVTTNASGTFNGTYNRDTKILTYTITYSGINPTGMHFHKGAQGVAGPVVIPITVSASPISAQTPALTAEQEADLLVGNWYVNVHSQPHPAGEIRGQLVR
ncbi:CHRD domain-containing protein [soil metagenome]